MSSKAELDIMQNQMSTSNVGCEEKGSTQSPALQNDSRRKHNDRQRHIGKNQVLVQAQFGVDISRLYGTTLLSGGDIGTSMTVLMTFNDSLSKQVGSIKALPTSSCCCGTTVKLEPNHHQRVIFLIYLAICLSVKIREAKLAASA